MASHTRRAPVATDKRLRKRAGGDHGPTERWQHSGRALELTDRAGILAVRATEEHVLDILALKHLLSAVQVEAGLKFKADFHTAALGAHVSASYSGMPVSRDTHAEPERNATQEAAYRRWRNAVRELGARGPAVIATVCHDAAPLPRDLLLLQAGLEKLAIWYGIRRK